MIINTELAEVEVYVVVAEEDTVRNKHYQWIIGVFTDEDKADAYGTAYCDKYKDCVYDIETVALNDEEL